MVREIRNRYWQELCWLLLALLTPLFVNLWVEQQFEASKVWLARTLIGMLLVVWVSGIAFGKRTRVLPAPVAKGLILLSAVLLLSTVLSRYRPIAVFGSLDRANGVLTQLSYFILFAIVATGIDRWRSRRLISVIMATSLPICLLGLAQALGWQPWPLWTDARSPLTTTLGRANFTGAYLAILVPLTVTAAGVQGRGWRRGLLGALVLLQLLIIGLSQARSAWIAAAAGLGVLLWMRTMPGRSSGYRWATGLGGIALLGALLLFLLQAGIAAGGSIAARWTIWRASLILLWPRLWLGYGADTLALHFPAVYPPELVYYQGRDIIVDRAHNWLLDWSLSYGIVATLLLCVLLYFVLSRGWRSLVASDRLPDEGESRLWTSAAMASIAAHLTGNLFLFETVATAVLFWLLLALVLAASTPMQTVAVGQRVPSWLGKTAVGLALLAVGWATWHANLRPFLADMHSWQGTQTLHRGDAPAALAAYRRAVQWQPHRTPYRVALGLTAARLGQFPLAQGELEQAIALHPTDPVLYTQLASIYAGRAETDPTSRALAYGAFEQAIVLAPTIGATYQKYADFALRLGDVDNALLQAERAVDLDATDGVAFAILGWAHLQRSRPAAAQVAFEEAVRWQPNVADFHLGLATALAQQDKIAEARLALQRSMRIDPAYGPSQALWAQLHR